MTKIREVIHHQQIQPLLPFFAVQGGEQHPTGIDAHHLARRKIGDGHKRLADERFRGAVPATADGCWPVKREQRAGSTVESTQTIPSFCVLGAIWRL